MVGFLIPVCTTANHSREEEERRGANRSSRYSKLMMKPQWERRAEKDWKEGSALVIPS
jgi:hypothetical protein